MIKLGIIGLSEGNGHPYSWSAIFNGFSDEMDSCPFPVIPAYLKDQQWPDAKITNAEVTHIWTQDIAISEHVAKSTYIKNISSSIEELTNSVDGILLARDDANNHLQMARPIIESGKPVFIDKPLSFSLSDAKAIYQLEKYEGQIYTCSSLRYAEELFLNIDQAKELGDILYVEGQIPKSWERYSIHLIDPILKGNPNRGKLKNVTSYKTGEIYNTHVAWENLDARISTYAHYNVPLKLTYFGENGFYELSFQDTFSAFKKSLISFISTIENKKRLISKSETLESIKIIEGGLNA